MATITYTISSISSGVTWSGTFEVTTTTNQVKTEIPTLVTANSSAYTFVPDSSVGFKYYPDATLGHNYVTWRTYNGDSQYPDSGSSFDVWSSNLYTAIVTNNITWAGLVGNSYSLNTTKHTLIYNYGAPYAPYFCMGGNIAFS